jgi:hypothetical protein
VEAVDAVEHVAAPHAEKQRDSPPDFRSTMIVGFLLGVPARRCSSRPPSSCPPRPSRRKHQRRRRRAGAVRAPRRAAVGSRPEHFFAGGQTKNSLRAGARIDWNEIGIAGQRDDKMPAPGEAAPLDARHRGGRVGADVDDDDIRRRPHAASS